MIRTCAHCGRKNRIPVARLADAGRCGACKAPLEPLNEPLDVDPQQFDEIVRATEVPVIVDFWAAWCAPCKLAAPEVARAARNLAGKAILLKVDTERHPALAKRYGVRGIPNFVGLRKGERAFQHAGLVDHRRIERWVEQAS